MMLDLDHPETPYRFAALHQIELIHRFAVCITLGTGATRRQYYGIVEPAFVALRWLNEERFGNNAKILTSLNELDLAIQQLADAQHDDLSIEDQQNCPVCSAPVTEIGAIRPVGTSLTVPQSRHCENCFEPITNLLDKLTSATDGFGLEMI